MGSYFVERLGLIFESVLFPVPPNILNCFYDLSSVHQWVFGEEVFAVHSNDEVFHECALLSWVVNHQLVVPRWQECRINVVISMLEVLLEIRRVYMRYIRKLIGITLVVEDLLPPYEPLLDIHIFQSYIAIVVKPFKDTIPAGANLLLMRYEKF